MRLTHYTDYSLRVLIYLATKNTNDLTTIQEIADAYDISKNHLMKIIYELGKVGVIETIRGRNGGIRLAQAPENINLAWLVREVEEDFHLVECFNSEKNQCVLTPSCRLKGILGEALAAYFQVLEKYTLNDLVQHRDELSALFFPNG
ncbi:Rrf2 family transcriptional regulator [Bacillaceae bacterium SIJ1]|uniref:RrF2 family transcriptional regulator n=1 Tax=Litoribacterium kuwaitense TaxID=1398745 RepID=UPI0013EC2656|nr:Rrf2 family transcriptional regulator [Litoribacterium kuwaitense]NGP46301.1 Rrf2 family transcriptional regulator [Litoribacterium kuwaitense]